MPFSNGFPNVEIIEKNDDLFTTTNTKSILGRNIVKNYLCQIEFEIRTMGYSDSANDIALYYENCKNFDILEFFTNPVIKMILEEIQSMPTVKRYLKERIFDDIEQEKIENLNNLYNNNEKLTEKVENNKQEFLRLKELKNKKIKKIMKEKGISFEQAEKELSKQAKKKIEEVLQQGLSDMLSTEIETEEVEILLDDDFQGSSNDDHFWN